MPALWYSVTGRTLDPVLGVYLLQNQLMRHPLARFLEFLRHAHEQQRVQRVHQREAEIHPLFAALAQRQ